MSEPDLLSEFEQLSTRDPGVCRVMKLRKDLPEDERAKLDAALDAPHIHNTAIVRWFSIRGKDVSEHTVRVHRNDRCVCSRGRN